VSEGLKSMAKLVKVTLVEFSESEKIAPEEFAIFCKIFTPA
jgi:hypothetical protein